ncbi:hypothetical protein [Pararhodobacter oceanensis]|uniref:hypothetical protein n=1 Tax=Pararhodobacter oceanensis TaxID=2172121 RepID=UPI003A8DA47D
MMIQRFALATGPAAPADAARPDCLGCADCTGICWSIVELSFHRPNITLKRSRTPDA